MSTTPRSLHDCIEGLNIRPDGVYVDVTFGGGGHSRAILEKLGPQGRLVAFDRDADAAANVPDDPRFTLVRSDFRGSAITCATGRAPGERPARRPRGQQPPVRRRAPRLQLPLRRTAGHAHGPAGTSTAADLVNTLAEPELAALLALR